MNKKHTLGIRHTFIGDSGVTETKDIFGFFSAIISVLVTIGLIVLGVLAYIS